jgi:sterol desaturase/sphingolipid hydroxylase (fatty acid hydroxylase superfamily)
MDETLAALEPAIRLGVFAGVFGLVALWEVFAPRRGRSLPRRQRWPRNLALVVIDTLTLRLLAPGAVVAVAIVGEAKGWGLVTVLGVSGWAAIALSVLLLDLAVYFQHVLFHAVPVLWRLHRTHHSDPDFDVTTGTRFHPAEILLSAGIKMAAVAAIGAPALAVLLFEVVLNATAMFNHGNARLPAGLDRWLRLVVVTPDMHRVHHSVLREEADSNFGFNVPWWDRLFGTYRAQPRAGHAGMVIGVAGFLDAADQTLGRLLLQPFRNPTPGVADGDGTVAAQRGPPRIHA